MKLYCSICSQPVTNHVPAKTILRGIAICPECMERVPEDVFTAFIKVASGQSSIDQRPRQELVFEWTSAQFGKV